MSSDNIPTCLSCKSNRIAECDNSCGTQFCLDCKEEWYGSHTKGRYVFGHHPECGFSSSDEQVIH